MKIKSFNKQALINLRYDEENFEKTDMMVFKTTTCYNLVLIIKKTLILWPLCDEIDDVINA